MTDTICPLCGKPNPPELDECLYCQAPLKTSGFIAPSEGQDEFVPPSFQPGNAGEFEDQEKQPESISPLEQAIPDWLKQTEANFLEGSEVEPGETAPDQVSEQIASLLSQPSIPDNAEKAAIDDDWLASLLSQAGVGEPAPETPQEVPSEEGTGAADTDKTVPPFDIEMEDEQFLPPDQIEKPEWLQPLEAASTIKQEIEPSPSVPEGRVTPVEETEESEAPAQPDIPEWVKKPEQQVTPPSLIEPEPLIAPAELPGWLEALRPADAASPSEPVEDVSTAEMVTAGPLVGLRGVISAHPSAIRARKPPTYSIKLRVTDEQRSRVEMMEALLADEQKPKPLPSQPIISSRNIFRLIIAIVLILPIVWMIIASDQRTSVPQPGNIPGVVDFNQQIQLLTTGSPVLLAFDYEPGFSGEMNVAINTLITQLMLKKVYMTLVATTPSGPALAESLIKNVSMTLNESSEAYTNYANLGYIPGGTIGLVGLGTSPEAVLPYSTAGTNVWAVAPLNTISGIGDFSAVIVMTNDPDTARIWIEQVGTLLQPENTPFLIITSTQAEPMIYPYYKAASSQVQGLVAGLAGGLAYSRTVGTTQQNGLWDAFSIGITVSIVILLIGSIIGVVIKMLASSKKMEN
jgi:hypothetical protein